MAIPSQPLLWHALWLSSSTMRDVRNRPRIPTTSRYHPHNFATWFMATGLHHYAALDGILSFDFAPEIVASNRLSPPFQRIIETITSNPRSCCCRSSFCDSNVFISHPISKMAGSHCKLMCCNLGIWEHSTLIRLELIPPFSPQFSSMEHFCNPLSSYFSFIGYGTDWISP